MVYVDIYIYIFIYLKIKQPRRGKVMLFCLFEEKWPHNVFFYFFSFFIRLNLYSGVTQSRRALHLLYRVKRRNSKKTSIAYLFYKEKQPCC